MAWPSGSKASTTNVDQPTDYISDARADIKQNIDNVNDMIDHINISSPNNGDLLQYSSSSGKWEQVASTAVGSPTVIGRISLTSGEELVESNTYRRNFSISFDPEAFLTKDGTYQLTLGAGNYVFLATPQTTDDNEVNLQIYDETADTGLGGFGTNEIGTSGESLVTGAATFTFASSGNVSFRVTTSTPGNRNYNYTMLVYKF